jgi:tRNA(His) 5'-end guanylyltransferase
MAASFDEVLDYFRWRQSDAARCALNGAAYWALRKEGLTESQATRQLEGKAPDFKHELLFQRGVHFNALPVWQRRGVGLHWESYTKDALNPKTGERVQAWRRRIAVDEDIPYKEAWAEWVRARSEPLQKPD